MASFLPMVQQFLGNSNSSLSASPSANNTLPSGGPSALLPNDVSSFIALLYSYSALRDWLKLIVIGGIFESFRRLMMTCYRKFLDSFFIRATFDSNDASYRKTRDMQITTFTSGGNSPAVVLEGEEEYSTSSYYKSSRKISYLPSTSMTYSLWYKRRWITIQRMQQSNGPYGDKENTLHISILTRNHNVLIELLQEARRLYMAGQEHSMCIYVSDSSNNWNHVACRAKRSLNSIVLDPGVKDILLEDARDFLDNKSWYAERGIPFRRGYLLYGVPGSGKTSMIHCMAGELKLDVYVISLSRSGLDDASLSELVNALPERCIALMEDIDAAFTQSVSRGGLENDKIDDSKKAEANHQAGPSPAPSKVSLSGLLNALDGVGAQEGRILFATTNCYSALDQALCRPGRMDLHIEFKNASRYQATELFSRFYLPTPLDDNDVIIPSTPKPSSEEKNEKQKTIENPDFSIIKGQTHRQRSPTLSQERITELAERFANAVPDRECSMASLQGYLMSYKTRPIEAADGVAEWVEKERERKREKAEKTKEEEKKKAESSNQKEDVKDDPPAVPAPVLAPTACTCSTVPLCSTCGGAKVKDVVKDVVISLPSPVSAPATPNNGSVVLPLLSTN
ncbi:hypothetical protein H0H93_010019 [Arthromyces matolae]|nr:hypothetical protein H0H93_010019 [Arthromyces matolae]